MKICTKCKINKKSTEFNKDRSHKDGLCSRCKTCSSLCCREYNKHNKERVKLHNREYYKLNKEHIDKCNKKYNEEHKEKLRLNKKRYYEDNKEIFKSISREYYSENKKIIGVKSKKYHNKNKESIAKQAKKYREENKDKIKIYKKEYRMKHKEQYKQYCENNKEKIREQSRKYKEEHKVEIKAYKKEYDVEYNKRPLVRIATNLRTRVRNALKRNSKCSTTQKLVGCTFAELKTYLESKFKPDMSWENYGRGWNGTKEWQIDHIKPCSSFDLSKSSEQRKCFHYSNLQPLWAEENYIKGTKF